MVSPSANARRANRPRLPARPAAPGSHARACAAASSSRPDPPPTLPVTSRTADQPCRLRKSTDRRAENCAPAAAGGPASARSPEQQHHAAGESQQLQRRKQQQLTSQRRKTWLPAGTQRRTTPGEAVVSEWRPADPACSASCVCVEMTGGVLREGGGGGVLRVVVEQLQRAWVRHSSASASCHSSQTPQRSDARTAHECPPRVQADMSSGEGTEREEGERGRSCSPTAQQAARMS